MKIKSKQLSNLAITVIKTTSNQCVTSQKNSIMLEILSESLRIPNMNKTSLTGVPDMAGKQRIELNKTTRFLTSLAGERILPSIIAGENLSIQKKVLIGLSLFAESHF